MTPLINLSILFLTSTFAAEPSLPRHLHDDFESGALASFWAAGNYGAGRYEPGRMVITTNLARSGRHSLQITVREGDIPQKGNDGLDTERAEMDSGKWPLIGHTAIYEFSPSRH